MYSAQHESISDAELRLTFPGGPGSRYRVDLANLGPIATCDGPGWIGSGDEETSRTATMTLETYATIAARVEIPGSTDCWGVPCSARGAPSGWSPGPGTAAPDRRGF